MYGGILFADTFHNYYKPQANLLSSVTIMRFKLKKWELYNLQHNSNDEQICFEKFALVFSGPRGNVDGVRCWNINFAESSSCWNHFVDQKSGHTKNCDQQTHTSKYFPKKNTEFCTVKFKKRDHANWGFIILLFVCRIVRHRITAMATIVYNVVVCSAMLEVAWNRRNIAQK